MAYPMPNSVPSRPSTPQFPRYSCQPPSRQQYSRSPPPYNHPLNYPTSYPQPFSSPRRLSSPPPLCTSPHLHCHQPNTGEHINPPYTCARAWEPHRGDQRRHNGDTISTAYHCSKILDYKLERPTRKSLAAGMLLQKVSQHPEQQDPIPHGLLLHMFQHLYGSMLDSIRFLTKDLLQIEDSDAVTCKATICRFDKQDTWRLYKSRVGVQEHFYCAPHIEVTLPWLPTRAAIKEIIEAITDSCGALGKHMQPAYKFRTQSYSWKFEPGTIYETVDAGHLIPRPIVHDYSHDETSHEEEQQDEEHHNQQLITYTEEETFEIKPENGPRTLGDIKREWRFGPNTNQCKEIVKGVLAKLFKLDPRHITVWFWVKDVELNDSKWYPWGSLDNTYGLTLVSQEIVRYDPEDAKGSPRRNGKSSRATREKELRDVAPTVRIILPVERKNFAKDDENVKWLQECVDVMRTQLSATSASHSRAAFCISWKKERRDFADWFGPQVVYKLIGDGDHYILEDA
ncbi:hypothetical protein F5B22DRAFT_620360 [Xylaria bambusicola]|uniref:uncharacterized protein n=1 Tax=Xylaria bambusicola TaxID=326684 RepID=UPI00200855FC|nr:uncharacterized protein F5B22DRAFT_620360 [Xylaria bambusicola]KAI0508584.1 hypothetical protein F5B22DRAFT_620360 [Xylaria bambusicola]